jgi:hypothetical protein
MEKGYSDMGLFQSAAPLGLGMVIFKSRHAFCLNNYLMPQSEIPPL